MGDFPIDRRLRVIAAEEARKQKERDAADAQAEKSEQTFSFSFEDLMKAIWGVKT